MRSYERSLEVFEFHGAGDHVTVTLTCLATTDDLASRRPREVKDENRMKTGEPVLGPTGEPLYWLGEYVAQVAGLGGGTAIVETETLVPFQNRKLMESFELSGVRLSISGKRDGFGLEAKIVVPAIAVIGGAK